MDLRQLIDKNQSIKIVPSVEECIKASGLNIELDEDTQVWFQHLKATWKTWKKTAAIENHIETFFKSNIDPFRLALVFVIKCEEFKDCKPKSLPFLIIEILQKCSTSQNMKLEESLKLPAFHIALQQRNRDFLSMVLTTYQVVSVKDKILPILKNMLKNENGKHLSQVIITLDLFSDIPVEDILFPLILQDKVAVIDDYLTECPNQIKPFLLFIDKLLDKKINIREYAERYVEGNNIGFVRYDKLHYKPLGKLLGRLCKKFSVPVETCKNLSKNRTACGLRYLIHKKYVEHNVSLSEWEDLVKDSLTLNADSAHEFIDILTDYDLQEAHKWATFLRIDENLLPLALRGQVSLNESKELEEENWDCENSQQEFYSLALSENQIHIVDSAETFHEFMMSDLPPHNIVSIDCEWKPSFGATQSQVAIIQIATSKSAHLIDVCKLNNPDYSRFWHKFNKSLLSNAEIIKVGFGLEQDLKEIKSSITSLSNIKVKGEGLLDLCLLWKNLMHNGLRIGCKPDVLGNKLTSLVECCFGLPLQKSEQCSNWELRPLRDTQIKYAALDAFVLVELYYYLQKISLEQGINFDDICSEVMLETKKKPVKKLNVAERLQLTLGQEDEVESEEKAYIPAKNIKLMVEPDLSNLTSYLRYGGIDTIIISTSMLWHDVINLALSEERLILVSKQKMTPNQNFPQSSVLYLSKNTIKNQLQKILKTYRINIEVKDLMSRCIYCNDVNLKNMTKEDVIKLCNEYETSNQVEEIPQKYFDYYDTEENYENFLDNSDCEDEIYQPDTTTQPQKCTTSKGVTIVISDVKKLSATPREALLCDSCGMLLWEEDVIRPISDVMLHLINKK